MITKKNKNKSKNNNPNYIPETSERKIMNKKKKLTNRDQNLLS